MQYHYRLYGLSVGSDVELPELVPAVPSEVDVRIRFARLPKPEAPSDQLVGDARNAGFFIEDVAHYRVVGGREILVDPLPGASRGNVRLYLLGSAMGLLLHQRGSLPLHANAVEICGCGIAFVGPSGSGKSTLAAAFHDSGFRIIADDVCLVSFGDDGMPAVHGGVPRLRLWEDALTATGRSISDYQLSYAGDEQFLKFDVPTHQMSGPSAPLSAIFELASGEQVQFDSLAGLAAVEAIFANTYRGGFVATAGDARAHWQACLQLVTTVPIFRLQRPLTQNSLAQIVARFECDDWLDRIRLDVAANN